MTGTKKVDDFMGKLDQCAGWDAILQNFKTYTETN